MTETRKVAKAATFYRTITKTLVTVSLPGTDAKTVELGGDVPVGKAIARVKEMDEFKGVEGLAFSVNSSKEQREMDLDTFIKYSTVKLSADDKEVEQAKTELEAAGVETE